MLGGFSLGMARDGAGRAADRRAHRTGDDRSAHGAGGGLLFGGGAAGRGPHEGGGESEQAESLVQSGLQFRE